MTAVIKVIAHRGFSDRYPENTMLAFERAIAAGCDGIELDVHLTRDGEVAVIHDEDIARTTNGKGLVADMTMEELRRFDAGKGQRIPTLQEYFDLAERYPILTNIELKNSIIWYEGMEEKVIRLVRERHMEERVLLSSFNHYSIQKCKAVAPDIRCGFLTSCWILDAGAYTKRHGVECLHPEIYNLTPAICEEVRRHGIEINTWTVNTPGQIQGAMDMGVNSIITNDPVLLRKTITGERAAEN